MRFPSIWSKRTKWVDHVWNCLGDVCWSLGWVLGVSAGLQGGSAGLTGGPRGGPGRVRIRALVCTENEFLDEP